MQENNFHQDCKRNIMAIHDSMDVLGGKWKISIIAVLCYLNGLRFSEVQEAVGGISKKMLSKELKELEMNKLVKRTVTGTRPLMVEYELTDYGRSLRSIMEHLAEWGMEHRREIFRKEEPTLA